MNLSKGNRLGVALVITIALYGCGVDNEQVQQELVGSWILQQTDKTECDSADDNGSEGFICSSVTCSRLIFSDSSTYRIETTVEGVTSSESGTYNTDGAALALCTDGDEGVPAVCEDFRMTLQDNTLVLSPDRKVDGCFVRNRYVRF